MNSFYEKKRVLITGATGFIGTHLLRELKSAGAEIGIISRNSTSSCDYVFIGSLDDKKFVSKALSKFKPEVIFHLAAERERALTYEAFSIAIKTNLNGTLNLLFAALSLKNLSRVVILGTAEEYGDNEAPFHEDMRESSVSAYSFSKQSSTHLAQLMYKSFQLPTVVIRPSLVYGPGQNSDMFLPALIESLINNKIFPMTLGEQTRDYIFVGDVVEALLKSGHSTGIEGEILNVGSGTPIQINLLVKQVENILNVKNLALVGAVPYRTKEQMNYWLDVSKAKKLLNWSSKTSIEDGLKQTIAWYRQKEK